MSTEINTPIATAIVEKEAAKLSIEQFAFPDYRRMNEIIELLKTAVAEILNETEPKDLSKNPEKSLDIVSKASIHCQTKGVNDGQKY